MQQQSPSLQLFILCCDRPNFAREAIQSALRQTVSRFQIIVSDNSTNSSVEAVVQSEFPGLDYRRRTKHLSVLEHLNQCLGEATADYVCLFHDDDLLGPYFVERVLEEIGRHPTAAAIAVNAWLAEDGKPTGLFFNEIGPTHLIRGPKQLAAYYYSRHQLGIAPFPSYIYRMALVGSLRFDESAGKFSDVAWLLLVATKGVIVWIVEPLMTYRLHSSNDGRRESIRDRLKLFGYFKKHATVLGSGLLEDFRFFLYKKLLEPNARNAQTLSPARMRLLRTYMMGYRIRRFGRLDHHWSLLRRTGVRMMLYFRPKTFRHPPGAT